MIKVGIVGASGYTGAELLRLLHSHPAVEVAYLSANRYAGQLVTSIYPHLTSYEGRTFSAFDLNEALKEAHFFFLALPHGKSMEVAPALVKAGRPVVDLSGDFRLLDKSLYPKWYGFEHRAPSLISKAVYGLPELKKDEIVKANFVANPGCFPTSVLLATAPLLLEKRLLTEETIYVTSLTGVSGAGRQTREDTHFCFCDENVSAYKVGGEHQHLPEMEQEMNQLIGSSLNLSFTPVLSPFSRGIFTVIYLKVKKELSSQDLLKVYRDFYRDKPFVKLVGENSPQIKSVLGSNFCHVGLKLDRRNGCLTVMATLDNLVKGAAGQAIQNMNLMMGLEECLALESLGVYP
jgi:N-acetyl-gamma-glutamyl-phosphate reductase